MAVEIIVHGTYSEPDAPESQESSGPSMVTDSRSFTRTVQLSASDSSTFSGRMDVIACVYAYELAERIVDLALRTGCGGRVAILAPFWPESLLYATGDRSRLWSFLRDLLPTELSVSHCVPTALQLERNAVAIFGVCSFSRRIYINHYEREVLGFD